MNKGGITMKSIVYDLGYDFQQKNGHYLMFNEKNGEQLTDEALIPLQVRMMQSNQIPNLLQLSIEEMDFNIKLYYDITSKRTLDAYLKVHTFTSYEFYQLFINILTTLEKSKLYMLDEHQYILKESFIYIGKEPQQLYLTYVPVKFFEKEKSTLDEIKELLLSVSQQIEGFQGSEKKHLVSYVKDPSFSVNGLKELLMNLQQLRPAPYMAPQQGYSQPDLHTHGQAEHRTVLEQSQPIHAQQQEKLQKKETDKVQPKQNKKTKKKEKEQPQSEQKNPKFYISIFAILLLVIVWKVYEIIPSQVMLYVSASLTAVITVSTIFFLFKRPRKQTEGVNEIKQKAVQEREVQEKLISTMNKEAMPSYPYNMQAVSGDRTYTSNVFAPPEPTETESNIQPVFEIQNSVSSLSVSDTRMEVPAPIPFSTTKRRFVDTNLQFESDDTVLLEEDDSSDEEMVTYSRPVLEVERNGDLEEIIINEDHFTIGRSTDSVNYMEDTVGVSRMHIELIRIEDSYGLKDLGSKNGSKLNGENIVPYKIYALNSGDVISLGKIDYHFKWE